MYHKCTAFFPLFSVHTGIPNFRNKTNVRLKWILGIAIGKIF